VREGVVEAPREGMTGATSWGVEGRGYDRERSRSRETGEGRNGVDIDSTANARERERIAKRTNMLGRVRTKWTVQSVRARAKRSI
jgi:hypothetical protein